MTRAPYYLFRIGLYTLLAILSLASIEQAHAAKKNKKKPVSKKGAASELKTVDQVGKDHLIVGGKIYFIRGFAKIIVDGNEATLQQVKPGMQVSISARVKTYGKNGTTTTYEASRIVARSDNELAKKAEEENKKRKTKKNNAKK